MTRQARKSFARMMAIVGLAAAATGLLFVPANPVGANAGTVKIDGVDVDDLNPNEPHPVCEFTLQFFGFASDQGATYTFDAVPPAGSKLLVTGDVEPIDDDPTTHFVDLSAALQDPDLFKHPTQGFHVDVNIATWPTSDPSDQTIVKSKTFWVECDAPVPPTTAPPSTTVPATEPPSTTAPPVTEPPVTQASVTTVAPATTLAPVVVIDEVVERANPTTVAPAAPTPTTEAPSAQVETLPVTGPGSASYMAIMAGLLLAIGSAAYLMSAELNEARVRR